MILFFVDKLARLDEAIQKIRVGLTFALVCRGPICGVKLGRVGRVLFNFLYYSRDFEP